VLTVNGERLSALSTDDLQYFETRFFLIPGGAAVYQNSKQSVIRTRAVADGFHEQWLANIARLRAELPAGATLHPGHGEPCGLEVLDWQERYIHTFLDAIERAGWDDADAARQAVVERMRDYLPSGELQFLMELSIRPLAPAA